MLKIASGQAVRRPHAAAPSSAPLPAPHDKLGHFAARCLALPRGCVITRLADGCDPAFLMIERFTTNPEVPAATWLVSLASASALRLEALVGELRVELLAEGPPDRIFARLHKFARDVAAPLPAAPAAAPR